MAGAVLDQSDTLIRDAVTQQLEWDPEVDSRDIAATVRNGVVTLTGYIGSYAGKLAAERAVKRVRGVRVVANDIQVRQRLERPDPDEQAVMHAPGVTEVDNRIKVSPLLVPTPPPEPEIC